MLGTWFYLGVESLSEASETSDLWVDAPGVGVGLGCAPGAVPEVLVLVGSVDRGTGLQRSHLAISASQHHW